MTADSQTARNDRVRRYRVRVVSAVLAGFVGASKIVRWQAQAVPDPRFGQEIHGFRGLGFDFLPQLIDHDAKGFDILPVIRSPGRLQDLEMPQCPVGCVTR
jgi:hypothetical protein